MGMGRDLICPPKDFNPNSFLKCASDCRILLRKLFVQSNPYSEQLIRLLTINTKDCLENTTNENIRKRLKEMSLAKLRNDGYIRLEPKVKFGEHEEVKSYLLISFDNFMTNTTASHYRDYTISFDILCHTDYWDIGGFRTRPLMIAGIIDGLLDGSDLGDCGYFNFLSCNQIVLDEVLSGYTLTYRVVAGATRKAGDNG
jgi:hypothetical protein